VSLQIEAEWETKSLPAFGWGMEWWDCEKTKSCKSTHTLLVFLFGGDFSFLRNNYEVFQTKTKE